MNANEYYNLICSNRAKMQIISRIMKEYLTDDAEMQIISRIMKEYLTDDAEIDDLLNNRDKEPTQEQIDDELYRQEHLDEIIKLL